MDVKNKQDSPKSGRRKRADSDFKWIDESGDEDEFTSIPKIVELQCSPTRFGWHGSRPMPPQRRESIRGAASKAIQNRRCITRDEHDGNGPPDRKRASLRRRSEEQPKNCRRDSCAQNRVGGGYNGHAINGIITGRPKLGSYQNGLRKKKLQKLSKVPETPERVFYPVSVKDVSCVTYQVVENMHFSSLDLNEEPVFVGSGSYGEVSIYPKYNLAVKTAIEGFRSELLMTLVVSECAIRAKVALAEDRILTLLAFSLSSKQLVFPAYDMDMGRYCRKLSRMNKQEELHWRAIERAFMGLGRAVVYLNVSCGLTHLDIKPTNIFVRVSEDDNPIIENAVLGDFSLALFNCNSTAMKSTFLIDVGRPKPYPLRVCRGNVRPMFEMILGHGQTQPCEVMLDAMNGDGLLENKAPLTSDVGVSIDMYALGQSLLELVLTGGMNSMFGYGCPRNAGYFYHHKHIRRDYLLEVLAYRCLMYKYIFPTTPLTTRHDVPWERVDVMRRRLNSERYRAAFDAHVERLKKTHTALFENLRVPPMLQQAIELASVYCHSNPKARSATPLLWR